MVKSLIGETLAICLVKNDITADVAQHERSNIKCYASIFSII